jgi:hypothetical protein
MAKCFATHLFNYTEDNKNAQHGSRGAQQLVLHATIAGGLQAILGRTKTV